MRRRLPSHCIGPSSIPLFAPMYQIASVFWPAFQKEIAVVRVHRPLSKTKCVVKRRTLSDHW
jgi:hypothetical protein